MPRRGRTARHHAEAEAPAIRARIVEVLMLRSLLSEEEAEEAAFHLTDWLDDLADLNDLFARKRWNPDAAYKLLMGFVAHAPNHLAAAHRILFDDPLNDIFEIGAVKGSGRPKRKPGASYRAPRRRTTS